MPNQSAFDPATGNVDDLDDDSELMMGSGSGQAFGSGDDDDDDDDAAAAAAADDDDDDAAAAANDDDAADDPEPEPESAPAAAATPERPSRPAGSRSGSGGRSRGKRTPPRRALAARPVAAQVPTVWERSPAERAAIDAAFEALDRDGDGSLLPQDIIEASQELGLHFKRPEIYQLIGEHDANGEGRIQGREFRGIMVEGVRPADLEPAEFNIMWAEFDRGDLGYVDAAALRAFFAELGEDPSRVDVDAMIREAKQGRDAGTPDADRVRKDELHHLLAAAHR